jgi:hypothetical protein
VREGCVHLLQDVPAADDADDTAADDHGHAADVVPQNELRDVRDVRVGRRGDGAC